MRVDYDFDITSSRRTVVTVGSFDGVHAGHRMLLDHLRHLATRLSAESVVVTFDPHPRIAMGRAEGMQLLTTIDERVALLAEAGIDRVVVAHFDDYFRAQPYEEFVRRRLVSGLGMVGMIVGYNHRLGQGSEGNYDRLQPLAEECGFELVRVAQHTASGDKISSTVVRNVLARGDMQRAELLLGTKYRVSGMATDGVVRDIDQYKLLPPSGSYLSVVRCGDTEHRQMITIDGRTIHLANPLSGNITILL